MTNKILLIIAVIVLTASTCSAGQWLWHHNEEIKGQVVTVDTFKPIEGALIIAVWKLEDVVNEGPGGYDRVEVVESDMNGRFVIPSWVSFKPWQLLYKIENNAPFIFIFKPGYKIIHTNRSAREGFPGDTSISESGKRIIMQRYGLEPAKLEKIKDDNERMTSLRSLELYSGFPDWHFSREQVRKILRSFEVEINNLSDDFVRKEQLLINIDENKKLFGVE